MEINKGKGKTMKEKLLKSLHELGVGSGDILLVHSSMKAIGTTLSAEEIIDILQEAVGEEGTLLLPALTYGNVTKENPVFITSETVPCIGLLPRTFLNMPGVIRSTHPTHSVCARGKRAKELTEAHHLDRTPVGKNSPFMKLIDFGGKLIFIGEILDSCTFMHGVEENVGTDYVLTKDKIHYVVDGEDTYHYSHDFRGWGAEYSRIKDILDDGELIRGSFGQAPCYVVDPKALKEKASKKIKEDMHYFVEDISTYE